MAGTPGQTSRAVAGAQDAARNPDASGKNHEAGTKIGGEASASGGGPLPSVAGALNPNPKDSEVGPGAGALNPNPNGDPCEQCGARVFRYRCPRCQRRTCSAACVKAHKAASGCTGEREPTEFVALLDFDDNVLASDLRFLESAQACQDSAKRLRRGPLGLTNTRHFRNNPLADPPQAHPDHPPPGLPPPAAVGAAPPSPPGAHQQPHHPRDQRPYQHTGAYATPAQEHGVSANSAGRAQNGQGTPTPQGASAPLPGPGVYHPPQGRQQGRYAQGPQGGPGLDKRRATLQSAARRQGVELLFMPPGMSRHQDNASSANRRGERIMWTVEWKFILVPSTQQPQLPQPLQPQLNAQVTTQARKAVEEVTSAAGAPTGTGEGENAEAEAEIGSKRVAQGAVPEVRSGDARGENGGGPSHRVATQQSGGGGEPGEEPSNTSSNEPRASVDEALPGEEASEGAARGQGEERAEGPASAQETDEKVTGREGGGAVPLWEEAARAWGTAGPDLNGIESRLKKQTPEAVIVTLSVASNCRVGEALQALLGGSLACRVQQFRRTPLEHGPTQQQQQQQQQGEGGKKAQQEEKRGVLRRLAALFRQGAQVLLLPPTGKPHSSQQMLPSRTTVDMRRTLEETLRSQTVVEFPTFHVLVVGNSAAGNL